MGCLHVRLRGAVGAHAASVSSPACGPVVPLDLAKYKFKDKIIETLRMTAELWAMRGALPGHAQVPTMEPALHVPGEVLSAGGRSDARLICTAPRPLCRQPGARLVPQAST